MRWLALALFLTATTLVAQRDRPYFRASFGAAGGNYGFDSDLAGFDDDADAGLLQARFEYTTRKGIGGGIRFEHFRTERDEGLFRDPSNLFDRGTQARSSTFLAHGTFRFEQHRFSMPVRFGILVNGLTLDDHAATDPETDYVSAGPFFEVEPELILFHRGKMEMSVYTQAGFGAAGTLIEVDGELDANGDLREYESSTGFAMFEVGTRLKVGKAQFGIAFVGRYQSMDRSEFEGNNFIFGYDSGFEGVLLTAGVTF